MIVVFLFHPHILLLAGYFLSGDNSQYFLIVNAWITNSPHCIRRVQYWILILFKDFLNAFIILAAVLKT